MTDVPMFDMHPAARACGRCGRSVSDPLHDVCDYCIHLDHRTTATGCVWCAAPATGHAAADAGGQAAADADDDFAHQVQRALAVVRNRREPFSAVDVRVLLEEWGVPLTRPNAIGSVFRSAARAGVIRKTGRLIDSPIKVQHGHSHPEWVAA